MFMEIRKIENRQKVYAASLKLKSHKLFSDNELAFLFEACKCEIFEFVQNVNNESDANFYHEFVKWLQEEEYEGYVYYYLIAGMRKGECLSNDELEYLEINVTSCFNPGYGWLIQTNHELRFKRRLKLLIFSRKDGIKKLITETV